MPDVMHDIKLFVEMLLKVMIGKGIDSGDGGWSGWNKDDKHRAESQRRNIFRDVWPDRDRPLPWRLTPEEIKMLDERMGRVTWPHYVDRQYYEGCSFWIKPSRLWKTQRKVVLLYYILATQLRDRLPRLRVALFTIIWALRRLDGQVYSYTEAKDRNILPGSRTIDPTTINVIHTDLIIGLCLLEGCLPVDHLNPGLHHLVHFAQYTKTHGCLRVLWMMFFERYNKHIKNLVRDVSNPEANLGNTVRSDVSSRYMNLVEKEYDLRKDYHHVCLLSLPDRKFVGLSRKEMSDLRMSGVRVKDSLSVKAFKIAHIMGIHFRAGEWGQNRCGSVVTAIRGGCSYYARVERFLRIDNDCSSGYAVVRWFSKPTYTHGLPLVVRVTEDGSVVDYNFTSIIPITDIHPSRVMVEHDSTPGVFYMMRDSGFDRM